MKNMNKEKMNCRSICCILIAILLTFLLIPQTTFADEQKVIRVGYDSNSQFIKEHDGHYYGYGVEYLEKMAEYTGWKYEYVRVDSWHDTFDMLRNGAALI